MTLEKTPSVFRGFVTRVWHLGVQVENEASVQWGWDQRQSHLCDVTPVGSVLDPQNPPSHPGLSLTLVSRLQPSGKRPQDVCSFLSLLELFLLGWMSPLQGKTSDLIIIVVQGIITSLTRDALAAQGCANYAPHQPIWVGIKQTGGFLVCALRRPECFLWQFPLIAWDVPQAHPHSSRSLQHW